MNNLNIPTHFMVSDKNSIKLIMTSSDQVWVIITPYVSQCRTLSPAIPHYTERELPWPQQPDVHLLISCALELYSDLVSVLFNRP